MILLWGDCENSIILKKKSQAFFNILKEPLVVQKQTLHQQKALDLYYMDAKGQGRGSIIRAWRCHRRLKNQKRVHKIQQNMLSRQEGVTSS